MTLGETILAAVKLNVAIRLESIVWGDEYGARHYDNVPRDLKITIVANCKLHELILDLSGLEAFPERLDENLAYHLQQLLRHVK